MSQERNFDFIAFDWKGTLEAKGGTKAIRGRAAVVALCREFEGDQNLITAFEDAWKIEQEILKKSQESNAHITWTLSKQISNALDRANVTDPSIREKATKAFLLEYNSPVAGKIQRLFDGAEALLERLSSSNIPIGLIRNSTLVSEQFQMTIDKCGAGRYFHVTKNVVLSGEVGYAKPDRRVFEAVLQKCNTEDVHEVNPHRILFIGNETEVDIVGAKQMGWKTVLITSTEASSNGLADWEISSLHDLHPIIFSV